MTRRMRSAAGAGAWTEIVEPGALARALGGADLIVDALLGTGVSGAARGPVAAAIEAVNRAGAAGVPVVALDLPSGLDGDRGALLGPTVKAWRTVTFAGLKRSLLLAPAAGQAGPVEIADIGVPVEETRAGRDRLAARGRRRAPVLSAA